MKWIAVIMVSAVFSVAGLGRVAASDEVRTSQIASVEQAATANIVDTAVAAGNFKTLVAAVQAAGLVDTLKGPGPFTVFAPTDAAFAALPAGTVDALLKDPAKLKDILLYHVVSGAVTSGDVVKLTQAKTVGGGNLTVSVSGSTVRVNDATVTAVDIKATNGVIHVIDKVLIPAAAAPAAAPKTGNAGSLTDGAQVWLVMLLAAAALGVPVAARLATRRTTR